MRHTKHVAAGVLLAMGMSTVTGCYAAVPVTGAGLTPGVPVILGITDAGRVAYGEQLGTSIESVEGRLVSRDSGAYTLSVTQLNMLRGGTQVWAGERIRIRSEHVSSVAERRLAKGRTALVTAAAVGAVFFIARSSLNGLLSGEEGKKPPEEGQTIKIPRP